MSGRCRKEIYRSKDLRGLLDGGATHALRTARDEAELESCTLTKVSLALGSAELYTPGAAWRKHCDCTSKDAFSKG